MGDQVHHARIARENLQGAIDELEKKRFSNVGLLSLRALEQMVEACASKEGLHFHEHPKTAHKNRHGWVKSHHPDLVNSWDKLWGLYGALGYGGLDGDRAKEALATLKKVLPELSRREGIAVAGL
nr:hypothetical protein [Candidatus Njordarchaeota archaeon]